MKTKIEGGNLRKTNAMMAIGLAGLLAFGLAAQEATRPVTAELATVFGTTGSASLGSAAHFNVMKFGGALKDSAGQPLSGVVGITFALYAEQAGGSPLWMETQNVSLNQGRYAVLLGSANAEGLPVELFASGEARWLGIRVDVEQEQARILLVSVPYAMKAAEAERLGGMTAKNFVLADQFTDQVRKEVEEQVAAEAEKTLTTISLDGSTKEIIETGVRSTFTDTNTTEVVFIDQLGTGFALRGRSTSGAAITGVSTALTGPAPGVSGVSKADIGKGILGRVTHPTGLTMGIRGETLSTAGRGIVGIATADFGPTIGIQAVTFSPDGVGIELVTKTIGGQLFRGLSGQPAVEVFSVSGAGDVTATAFAGDGSALTGIPTTALAFDIATQAELAAAIATEASTRAAADSTLQTNNDANTAALAAHKVSGDHDARYGQLNAANIFTTGTQTVQTGAAATKGLVVQGAAGQTAALQEWQDDTGAPVATVEADGTLSITNADIILGAGRGIILKRPDGSGCSLVSLENTGNLKLTTIACLIP